MSPANLTLYRVVSNSRRGWMPLSPRRTRCQRSSTFRLSEVTAPRPVTTTRRFMHMRSGLMFLDVFDGLPDSLNLFGGVVGNINVEFFLELHHKFDDVERIGAEVVDVGSLRSDLLLVHPQLLSHNVDHTLFNGSHLRVPPVDS